MLLEQWQDIERTFGASQDFNELSSISMNDARVADTLAGECGSDDVPTAFPSFAIGAELGQVNIASKQRSCLQCLQWYDDP